MTKALVQTVTVLNGTQVSSQLIDCRHGILTGIIIPSTLTGTAITFNATYDSNGGTATVVGVNSTSATAYSIPATGNAGKSLPIDLNVARSVEYLQLSTGTNEAADRTFQLIFREGDSAL